MPQRHDALSYLRKCLRDGNKIPSDGKKFLSDETEIPSDGITPSPRQWPFKC